MLVLLSIDQPDGHRHVACAEKRDVLGLVVLEHGKRALRQVGHRVASPVEDVDMQDDELCACFEDLFVLLDGLPVL